MRPLHSGAGFLQPIGMGDGLAYFGLECGDQGVVSFLALDQDAGDALVDGSGTEDPVDHDRLRLPLPVEACSRLLHQLPAPGERQPDQMSSASLQVEAVTRRVVRDENLSFGVANQEAVTRSAVDEVIDMRPFPYFCAHLPFP